MKSNFLKQKIYLNSSGYISDVSVFEAVNGQPGRFLRMEPATFYDEELRKVRLPKNAKGGYSFGNKSPA